MRMVIVGKSGSGKSHYMKKLLATYSDTDEAVLVIDSKEDIEFSSILPNAVCTDSILEPCPRSVIVTSRDSTVIDYYLQVFWKRGNCAVFIDELYHAVTKTGGKTLPSVIDIFTTGRSRDITIIGCTQRPAFVSLFVFSESTDAIIFDLQLLKDKKVLVENYPLELAHFDWTSKKYHKLWVSPDGVAQLTPKEN